jgi:REP element-mobilizing transposase RayT
MDEHESLNHSKWDCKYHVVFIPKCVEERRCTFSSVREIARSYNVHNSTISRLAG